MLDTLTVPAVLGIALFLICSLALSVFSFWIGRCARKIPIIDNNLPWTMSRARALRCSASCKRMSASCLTPPCIRAACAVEGAVSCVIVERASPPGAGSGQTARDSGESGDAG